MAELWDIYDKNRCKTGKYIERGQPMNEDEYHLVVSAWITNSKGEWLIIRRAESKSYPLKWEAPGGSVLAGEDSELGALREVKEEIGITLDSGELFQSYRRDKPSWENPGFLDVWVLKADILIEDVKLQKEEVCDIKWATKEEILKMIETDDFVPMKEFPYYKDLFQSY